MGSQTFTKKTHSDDVSEIIWVSQVQGSRFRGSKVAVGTTLNGEPGTLETSPQEK
jgi:hypothetical protein